MKKVFLLLLIIIFLSGVVGAEKYTINTSGQIKNNEGKIVSSLPQKIGFKATVPYIDILVDYSGSMESVINKLKVIAKNIVASVPNSTAVGLRKVGGDFTCGRTEQLAPVRRDNANNIKFGLNSEVKGDEPFVLGLEKAIKEDFANLDKNIPKKIVMITDGEYTCKDDPCAFANRLIAERNDIHIDIIYVKSTYLLFSAYDDTRLSCLANITGGNIYKTKDINTLQSMLSNAMNTVSDEVASKLGKQNNNYEFVE